MTASSLTQSSTAGPMRIPAVISTTEEGTGSRGKSPSTSGTSAATVITSRRSSKLMSVLGTGSNVPGRRPRTIDAMTELPDAPRWQGINHLALVTPDMDATVRFYVGVLGMRLAATTMAGPMRHYFFEMDRGNTVAFFEVEGAETFAKPAGGPSDRAIQLDHISFDVPDEHALEMLRKRLLAAGSEVTEVVDHGFIRSVYFTDPNGIALEASWWVTDPTGRELDFTDEGLFADPDPVPAVREISAGGLDTTPTTHLA
jgi:catechol 2,3-dioxygenase-like lactoylglutathione lyase family enzyme